MPTDSTQPLASYRPVAGGPFVLTFSLGMQLRLEKPVTFGDATRLIKPQTNTEPPGTINGVKYASDDLIICGGHMVICEPEEN